MLISCNRADFGAWLSNPVARHIPRWISPNQITMANQVGARGHSTIDLTSKSSMSHLLSLLYSLSHSLILNFTLTLALTHTYSHPRSSARVGAALLLTPVSLLLLSLMLPFATMSLPPLPLLLPCRSSAVAASPPTGTPSTIVAAAIRRLIASLTYVWIGARMGRLWTGLHIRLLHTRSITQKTRMPHVSSSCHDSAQ